MFFLTKNNEQKKFPSKSRNRNIYMYIYHYQ